MMQRTEEFPGLVVAQKELDSVFRMLERDSVTRFEEHLQNLHGRIFFTGSGRSGLSAQMASMRFMHLGMPTHFVGEATAPSIRRGDTLVIVSASGKTPLIVYYARIAKDEGASVLLVTSQTASPLHDIADCSVMIPVSETIQFGGTLFEQSALILLDSIVLDLMAGLNEPTAVMWRNHTNLQ